MRLMQTHRTLHADVQCCCNENAAFIENQILHWNLSLAVCVYVIHLSARGIHTADARYTFETDASVWYQFENAAYALVQYMCDESVSQDVAFIYPYPFGSGRDDSIAHNHSEAHDTAFHSVADATVIWNNNNRKRARQ